MEEKSFTIRLPVELVDRLDERTMVNLRSRTKEIHALLNFALDKLAEDAIEARKVGKMQIDPPQSPEE